MRGKSFVLSILYLSLNTLKKIQLNFVFLNYFVFLSYFSSRVLKYFACLKKLKRKHLAIFFTVMFEAPSQAFDIGVLNSVDFISWIGFSSVCWQQYDKSHENFKYIKID